MVGSTVSYVEKKRTVSSGQRVYSNNVLENNAKLARPNQTLCDKNRKKMKLLYALLVVVAISGCEVEADINIEEVDEGYFESSIEKIDDETAEVQYRQGVAYDLGEGVRQDRKKAAEFYRLSAEKGYPMAQYSLGVSYEYGEGVSQDYKKAEALYIKSSDNGVAGAAHNLGAMYFQGKGVSVDKEKAIYWFQRGADLGSPESQLNLGNFYLFGMDIKQDYAEAKRWLTKSAEQGNATAQKNLGGIYLNGETAEQDLKKAYIWLSLASINGKLSLTEHISSIKSYLSEEDIISAKKQISVLLNSKSNQ